MKKYFLLLIMMIFAVQSFSYVPVITSPKTELSFAKANLQLLLKLTPKKYFELTGKKLSLKEKIGLAALKFKFRKELKVDAEVKQSNLGLLSLIFGASAFVFAFIPAIGVISIGMAIAAVILGILGLSKKKGDTKSVIGLVLGSVFLLLILVALAAFSGW